MAGIRDALLAGKDWKEIAESQKRVMADANLAGRRQMQALLDAFESLASKEEEGEARMVWCFLDLCLLCCCPPISLLG